MARLSNITRDQLKPEGQKVYDEIASSRGSVAGPYGVLLHSPELAARVASTGEYVRFDFDMPDILKEAVILATAREMNSQYVFTAHARLARQAGVSEETIDAIAHWKAPASRSSDEWLVVSYAQELLRDHFVLDETFEEAERRFGADRLVELTVLIGHYLLVIQILAAFSVDLTPDMIPELHH